MATTKLYHNHGNQ